MPKTPIRYEDGIGGVGPVPRPLTASDEGPLEGVERSSLVPGTGRCPSCDAVVLPPAITCPTDGAVLEPVEI